MSDKEAALEHLLEMLSNLAHVEDGLTTRAGMLAVQWPTLAAALADLLAAHDMRVPRPFRRAAAMVHSDPVVMVSRVPKMKMNWCACDAAPRLHLHDGTIPGNPVIS